MGAISMLALAGLVGVSPLMAHAACPMPLAIYSEPRSGASVEFHHGESMIASNSFRMLLRNDVVLDGFAMWTDEPERPFGSLMHDCPEGDVTGDEIAACTAWEGVIYALDGKGSVSTLPSEADMAPPALIFAALGPGIRHSSAYGAIGREGVPWDVFELSGCQE